MLFWSSLFRESTASILEYFKFFPLLDCSTITDVLPWNRLDPIFEIIDTYKVETNLQKVMTSNFKPSKSSKYTLSPNMSFLDGRGGREIVVYGRPSKAPLSPI